MANLNSEVSEHTPAVLIIGAGPTGLTLACELARRGIAFRLIEAADGPQPGSRGKGLQPRSLEVFDDLGIIDRVMAHGQMAMPMQSTAPDGQVTLMQADVPMDRPDVPYAASVITPQWRVEEALRRRLAELGGAVEFGAKLDSFKVTDDGVSATILKGDQLSAVDARWLVGCDGGHSVVRKLAGIRFEGETLDDVRMIVADVEADGLDRNAWHVWRHAEGLLGLCPLPSTRLFQYQASLAPGQAPELRLASMQEVLARRSGRSDIHLRSVSWSSLWRANIRLADRYRQGAVFLAGDAAHIHSPAGGQGMNTGIQDAYNLGWKLAAVVQGAPSALLDTYAAERRPVGAGVLALSNARLQQSITQNAMPAQRGSDTTQLGIHYRDSVLSRDDRGGDSILRAGDRAPDAPGLMTVDGARRLFDLTRGTHFTLLSFGRQQSVETAYVQLRTLCVVSRPVRPEEIADTEGHLIKAYGATDQTLVLIRPDGYIATISDAGDCAAVSSYISALMLPSTTVGESRNAS